MAESWESLPDVVPVKQSWEDLPDVEPVDPRPERGFLDYLKAKWNGTADATPDVASLPGVKTIQTPTGVTHVDEQGRPVYTPEESQQVMDANAARFKQRVLEGGLSTLSGGGTMMDEMRGAMAIGDPRTHPKGESVGDTYRRVRDSTRRDVESATRNASPTVPLGDAQIPVLPMVGAAIPSILGGLPAGFSGKLFTGGATAALDAAGRSDADLSRGEFGNFASDVGSAWDLGMASSGAAEGLTAPMRSISKGAAARIGDVAAGQAERDVAQVGKEVQHLQGVARNARQTGSRYTENTLRRANGLTVDPSTVTDPTQLRAIAMLDNADFKALADSVAENTMDDIPAQLKRIADTKEAARSAAASAAQDASDRTRDYFKQSTFGTQIQPRLTTLAENAVLGGAAGASTGGAAGLINGGFGSMVDGVLAGLGGSALSGGSGFKTLAKNAMNSPLVQASALGALEATSRNTANAGALAARSAVPVGSALQSQAQQSQKTAFDELAKRFGINAKSKEELASEAFVRGQTGSW